MPATEILSQNMLLLYMITINYCPQNGRCGVKCVRCFEVSCVSGSANTVLPSNVVKTFTNTIIITNNLSKNS